MNIAAQYAKALFEAKSPDLAGVRAALERAEISVSRYRIYTEILAELVARR